MHNCQHHDLSWCWLFLGGRGTGKSHYGAMCVFFSGEEPESLRGPQAEMVIVDEIARMRYQQSVFDTMMLGLRLGDRPRVLIATTPRTTPFMKKLVAMDDIRITTGSTYDTIRIREVSASRGKVMRAEPISLLYEKQRVLHRHGLDQLEGEMMALSREWDRSVDGSPNRLDAMVWGLTRLSKVITHIPIA
jgi:phage terminase large subunit-like protein